MRIALYGNLCNNFYSIAKAIRKHSQLDVHLYLPDDADIQSLPESDDPHLKNNYPEWIHKGKAWRLRSILFFWRKQNIIKELSLYDVVVLADIGVSLAPFLKGKTAFFVTGSDLTVTPFPSIARKFSKSNNPLSLIKIYLYHFIQKRGIKHVDEIWSQPFYPFVNALEKLQINKIKIKDKYFPIIIDRFKFSLDKDAKKSDSVFIKDIVRKFNFVLFHPSRFMIDQQVQYVETGHWKKNDVLIDGFALFLKRYNIKDAGLVMIDRIYSQDLAGAKKAVEKAGINDAVMWLKPQVNNQGFTRTELVKLYSVADIVADDFGAGWFGSIVVEACSVGKPVLNYIDEVAMKQIYPWHPLLSSNTEEGISDILYKVYSDPIYAKSVGEKSRRWVEEFHSEENASKIYLDNFNEMI